MFVAVVPVALTFVTEIGNIIPAVTPVNVTFVPSAIVTAMFPELPTYKPLVCGKTFVSLNVTA
jgi:hypothetical protein